MGMKKMKNHVWFKTLGTLSLSVFFSMGVVGCGLTPPGGGEPEPQVEQPDDQDAPQDDPQDDPQDENQAPSADAGSNQAALGGDTVTLDGSGSSDPDGDALTFSWSQASGTPVALSDADTDSPSFTAPDSDEQMSFELTVEDEGGLTSTATVFVSVTAPSEPRLYIANFGGNNITSYGNPSAVNGNIVPDTNLAGAQTQLLAPSDIVVNGENQLLASNFAAASVTTYDDADQTNGNLSPDGNVQGAATQLNPAGPTTLAINTGEDLLFVADIVTDDIKVFSDTSSSTFNGNTAPIRTIASVDINNPTGINFGADDDLYVANNGANNVVVFANASSLNGNVNATRIITSAAFTSVFDVYIDAADTMYVVDTAGFIFTFFDASSLNGVVQPDLTLTVPGAVALSAIAVDEAGTAYIVDNGANAVFSYDDIDLLNGVIAPDRTIQGANTQLAAPIRVFLVE